MNDTSVYDKAVEVQEAAARAAIAERERLHDLLVNAEAGEAGYSAPDIGSDEFEALAPYPADPYEMQEISSVPATVLWLSVRESDGLPGKQASVETAQAILNSVLPEGFGRLFALVNSGKFEGSTKIAFVDYIDIIEGIAENQAALADELAHAVECVHNGLTLAREDVVNICDRTIKALDDIAEHGDSGGAEAMGFALLGALVGVAASVASGGTAGIVFSLISGGVSIAGTAATSGAADSMTIEEVLELFTEEVGKRQKEHEDHEDVIVDGLNLDLAAVNGSGDLDLRDKLDKDAGGLAGRRGDFHATGSATVADLKELYDLATVQVPDLADEFATASDHFDDANGTETAAMGPASSPWEALLDKLQQYVAEDAKQLRGAARVLAGAAQDFAAQDGVNAGWVRQPAEDLIKGENPSFPQPDVPVRPPYGPTYVP